MFPGVSEGQESACNAGDLGSISVSGRFPGERNGNSLQYSCLEKSHRQRSLLGYSPRGLKESNKTEWQAYAYKWLTYAYEWRLILC